MNCVVQIIEGENPVYEISQKTWRAFCRRSGASYHVLSAPSDYGRQIPDIYWAKWGALRSFFEELKAKQFERVVVTDSDTFCLWNCDAQFIGQHGDPIRAALELEAELKDGPGVWWVANEMLRASLVLGPPGFTPDEYVNAGMVILDDTHVGFLDELLSYRKSGNEGEFVEQTVINFLLRKWGYQVLPSRYNVTWPAARKTMIDGTYVKEASVIHCTGKDKSWMMRLWHRHHEHY